MMTYEALNPGQACNELNIPRMAIKVGTTKVKSSPHLGLRFAIEEANAITKNDWAVKYAFVLFENKLVS